MPEAEGCLFLITTQQILLVLLKYLLVFSAIAIPLSSP